MSNHLPAGVFLLLCTLLFLALVWLRAPKRGRFRLWGWIGLGIILSSELLLWLHVPGLSTFFTPVVWTGYLLLMDALAFWRRGNSLLAHSPTKFFRLAFWSVPLWLIFEAYNLRLANWAYVGLPENPLVSGLGYFWSFATIWPAIFETADFVRALPSLSERGMLKDGFSPSSRLLMFICGFGLVAVPVLVPVRTGQYLFGAVWVGFVFLLEPILYHWKGQSLLRDFERGDKGRFWSFLVAGLVCGVFWEFWNYGAGAKWIYVFPMAQGWKVFEMPLPGYLGFAPFALECLVLFEFVETLRKRISFLRRPMEAGASDGTGTSRAWINVPR